MKESLNTRSGQKPVGLTAAAGFQVGVRRTLPVTQEEAWRLLTSPHGLSQWLGEVESLELVRGTAFATREGNHGELRVVKPLHQLRMSWQRAGWSAPSTLQIRLLPTRQGGTTISFHQEKLKDLYAREQMKAHWEQVLHRLMEASDGFGREENARE
ncbi:SRPBCC family protein [Paenibacillus ihbetae]|uniref:ATPase n=3 Tax=Paenibacillus ihbetae TaxID=1870820 RepID=A0A1B2DZV2_9BACL|nr:SRPBCC domain-containing protein [Paenibacillus ihbetae]ANY73276.1 ATPase [Paenibacillus ihbetae]OOC59202.1 ATPase [Paenibacillus ihbetae]